tara:strand:- start:10 stop:387 length:378 start_codon:yes stop_codon:yes gene_type:complete
MEKMIIYTMNTCEYCKLIKEELVKNNIEFETRLTNEWKDEWNDIISLTNNPSTPIIHYRDSYLIPSRDFSDPQQLINALNNFKKSEFSESRQILEKVKTLNSNINIMFNRLDQALRQIEQKIDKQ